MVLVALAPLARAGTATIGPTISDFGDDTNGNGLFDNLVILVPLEVTVPGSFELTVMLYDSSGFTFIASNGAYFSLDSRSTIGIGLDGKAIRQAGIDGPYRADIQLYDPDNGWVLIDSTTYLTHAYSASQFEQSPIVFAPPHSDRALDLDSNGFYDLLRVEVNVTVFTAGTYIITGYIQDPSYTYQDTASVTVSMPAGSGQVLLNYSGWGIRTAGVDGPYTIWLNAMDLAYLPLASDTHTTQTYSAASFEQPPGALSPPYSDHGVDTDGDGLFNAIAVDVPVAVRSPAMFTVIVNLYDASGSLGLASGVTSETLDPGTPVMEIEVPTLRMVGAAIDGPYQVRIQMSAEDPNTGSTPTIGTDVAMTGPYTVDQFDGIPATLGPCSDQAIDRDTPPDGSFDVLAVNVTVNVTESGPYIVEGALVDSAMGFIAFDDIYVPQGTGNFTVTLNFPGVDIRNDGVSGPFYVQVYLATFLDSHYVQIDYESYTTASYDANDFAYAAPALLEGHLYDATSQTPLANTPIEAFNYRWLKEVFSVTDASGYYSFPVQEGSWVVTPEPYESNDQAIAEVNVTSPATSLDFNLTSMVPQTAYVNLTLGDWSHAERDRGWIFSYMADTARQYYDWWFGNRDGYLSGEEYNASLAWPGSVPPPLPSQSTGLFRVDGSGFDLVPGSNDYTVSDIAGSVFDPRPMTGLETGSFASPSAPGAGLVHTVEVNVSYDLSWNDRIYEISLPAGYVLRSYTAPSDFVVTGLGSANITVNPPLPADPEDTAAYSWVTLVASIPDFVPPAISSVAASPNPVEVGSPTTISAVITDENTVQSVSVEFHDSYGFSYGNITMPGSGDTYTCDFTPTLTVPLTYTVWAEDGAGNFANATGTLAVVDTTPPVIQSYSASPSPQEIGSAVTFRANVTDNGILWPLSVEVHAPGGALVGNYSMTKYLGNPTQETSQVFNAPGTYTFTVWARDDADHYASASGSFVMRDTTPPSVTGASAMPSPVEIHGDVSLAATVTDAGGVAGVNVEVRDGQNQVVGNYTMAAGAGNAYTFTFSPSAIGTFTYRITAIDSSGNAKVVTGSFSVQDTTDPAASAGPDQTVAQGGTVTFDGTGSTDNDAVATYTWSFSDGGTQTLSGASPTYTFAHTGTYTVTLTVADPSGNTATDTMTVTVNAVAPTTGSISGTVTDADGNPIAGATVDLVSGTTPVATTTTDAQGHFVFAHVNPGSYTIRVQASGYDAAEAQAAVVAGQTATTTVHLTITATPPPGIDWVPVLLVVVVLAAAVAGALVYLRRRNA